MRERFDCLKVRSKLKRLYISGDVPMPVDFQLPTAFYSVLNKFVTYFKRRQPIISFWCVSGRHFSVCHVQRRSFVTESCRT